MQDSHSLYANSKSLNQAYWSRGVAYFFSCPPKNVLIKLFKSACNDVAGDLNQWTYLKKIPTNLTFVSAHWALNESSFAVVVGWGCELVGVGSGSRASLWHVRVAVAVAPALATTSLFSFLRRISPSISLKVGPRRPPSSLEVGVDLVCFFEDVFLDASVILVFVEFLLFPEPLPPRLSR